jgi:hypothetical protein
MARWRTEAHLRDHFRDHGRELGCSTIEEYDASAQATLDLGAYFEFFDDTAEESRIGCYDRFRGRLTILDTDDQIVSHFRCPEWYVSGLLHNTYDPQR